MNHKHIYPFIFACILVLTSCKDKMQGQTRESKQKEFAQAEAGPAFEATPLSHRFEEQIDSLIAEMTIEEKTGLLHGNTMFATAAIERLGIPELKMTDGPLGIREELEKDSWTPLGLDSDYATYYPAAGALAATWNREMAHKFGTSVGEEARARDKDVLLSPAINIIRTPLGGRTYEYMTEDPFLNKKMAVPFVKGIQANNVAACVKHYAANNQETHRDYVNVKIDERPLREIYLPAFKATVKKAHAYSMMGAYNKFRGEFLCQNNYMLNEVLKKEWGFEGIVISDWAAVHNTVNSIKSGLDVEMGTPKDFNDFYYADPLIKAVKNGKVKEKEIDEHVRRVLRVMFNIKRIDGKGRKKGSLATEQHYKDAYDIASEAIVLLKNEGHQLPLNTDEFKSIAVIGSNAKKKNALGGFGAGVKTKREITPLEGLKNRLPESVEINYAEGYLERYAPKKEAEFGEVTQDRTQSVDKLKPEMVEQAVEAAKKSDVAVIFAGSNRDYETEASDRADLKLPFGQEKLIEKVLEVNLNTVVVMIAGAPFDIENISKKAKSLVWSWFNGSEGGNALADVLMGKVNPSGKLPWTMPKDLKDSPAHATQSFPGDSVVHYDEGILVGYRWFDTKDIAPLYPFGHGLSYTEFSIGKPELEKNRFASDEVITLEVPVKNTGKIDGREVVQVYVSKPGSQVKRAAQELKGFQKVNVAAGETKNTTVNIPVGELAYYNTDKKSWTVEPGNYNLKIGSSSRNIEQSVSIEVTNR